MPHRKSPLRIRSVLLALLGVLVFLCGFFVRSDEYNAYVAPAKASMSPEDILLEPVTIATSPPVVTVTLTPSPTARPTQTPTVTPPPATATPSPVPTQAPTVEPIILLGSSPQSTSILHTVTTNPFGAATVTPGFVTPVVPTPTPIQMVTPRPGPTPTYEYKTDAVQIEITRHASTGLVYHAVEIWLTDAKQLKSAFSSDKFDGATEKVSDIASRNNAVLAINGDFATFNNGGIIIRNGEVFRTNRSTRQLLVIDRNGDFIPYVDPPQNAEEVAAQFEADGVWQTLVFGPVLVADGQAVSMPEKFFINTKGAREPRTAVAQLGPLHYLFLVIDGRQDDYSKGVSLPTLQEMFLEYGAICAFNLDGGGSTTLYFQGDVVNKPGNGGQRHVPDILYIGQ